MDIQDVCRVAYQAVYHQRIQKVRRWDCQAMAAPCWVIRRASASVIDVGAQATKKAAKFTRMDEAKFGGA